MAETNEDTLDTTKDERTVSPSQGEKRNRTDDDDEESTARRVLQRVVHADVVESQDGMADSKASIRKLVLEDLWSSSLEEKKKAMINLLEETTDNDEEKQAEKQKQFYQVGGHLAVIKVMGWHQACKIVQEYGIKILVSATYKNHELKRAVADVGGIEKVLAGMMRFPGERAIVFNALKALSNLTIYHPNAEFLVNKLNGIPFIHASLNDYKKDYDVVLWACRVIHKLASVETLRKPLFEADSTLR